MGADSLHLNEVVECDVGRQDTKGGVLWEQSSFKLWVRSQCHLQQLGIYFLQRVLSFSILNNLADAPRGIHCGSKGQEGMSFQQHTADTGLVAGNQYLSICKASLEDQSGIC